MYFLWIMHSTPIIQSRFFLFPNFFFSHSKSCILFEVAVIWFVTQRATNGAWHPGLFRTESIHQIASKDRFSFSCLRNDVTKGKRNKIIYTELLGNAQEWLIFGFSLQYYYKVHWTGERKKNHLLLKGYCLIAQPVSDINTGSTKALLGCVREKVKHFDIYQLEINRPGE